MLGKKEKKSIHYALLTFAVYAVWNMSNLNSFGEL